MKNRSFLTMFAIAAAMFGSSLCASAIDYSDKKIGELINKGDGAYLIKKDNKGEVSSCVVVVAEEMRFPNKNGKHKSMILNKLKLKATAQIAALVYPKKVKTQVSVSQGAAGQVVKYTSTRISGSIAGCKELAQISRRNKKGRMEQVLVMAWSKDWKKLSSDLGNQMHKFPNEKSPSPKNKKTKP